MATQSAVATGLQPAGTSAPVRVQAIDFDLEIRGDYVSGQMEVQLVADSGEDNAANLRFPLPPDSVLHKAEIYLPAQEQWTVAETVGRREGEILYNDLVQQQYEPLLIQRIGTDFYRARVYPINQQGDLRMRVHYAHTLERTNNHYRLRIPFANKDATAATPADGVTIFLRTDADYWTANGWQMDDELGTPSTLDLANGTTLLNLEEVTLSKDITLDLTPKEPLSEATALYYQPEAENLPRHLHAQWRPDFSDHSAVMSQPRNVVFVIDISGSMSGAKIAQTRQAVINSLAALSEQDYFGLVAFESEVDIFRPNMRSGADISAAIEWVSNLNAGGSTSLSAGLTTGAAIAIRSPLVDASLDLLLVTDGRPNVGNSTLDGILADVSAEAEQLGRQIRIFSVGIGSNLDQGLLNGLAQQTSGESTFALDDNEITGQILDLFARVRGGGVSNVVAKVQVSTVQHTVIDYFNQPTEPQNTRKYSFYYATTDLAEFTWQRIFSGTTLQLGDKFNPLNLTGPIASVGVSLTGDGPDSTPITLSTPLSEYHYPDSDFDRIAAPLAAKTWADQLERQIDTEGETAELVNEAVRLARTYGIVTRYSSLLALQREDLYQKQGIERIARDPAGIALEPIADTSSVNENQIGGQGTDDGDSEQIGIPPPSGAYMPQPLDTNNGAAFSPPSPDASSPFSGGPNYAGGGLAAPAAPQDEALLTRFCEAPLLDEQFRLDIPRLNYQGQYWWASLQLSQLPDGTLRLTVLNYGPVAPPNHNSQCQPEEVDLSATMQLRIPLILSKKRQFTEVLLQAIETTDGTLMFDVIDYNQ